MTLLRMIPLLLACAISVPLTAHSLNHSKMLENNTRNKAVYYPPESIGKNLSITSSTSKTTTFRFLVKSLIGVAKKVKLTAKVIGRQDITPIPCIAEFEQLSERKNATLDFIIPVPKEEIEQQKLTIQCNVEYLPDYSAIIKHIETDAKTKEINETQKDHLINLLKKNQQNSVKSVQALKYIPNNKK